MSTSGQKDWKLYAEHIIDTIEKIQRLEKRGDLSEDDDLYDAALRRLQTISEATQNLPDELKNKYPEINWRAIAGFRNILVHGYLGDHIDTATVKDVIKNHMPTLLYAAKSMLASK